MKELHTAYNGEISVFEPTDEAEGWDLHVGGIHVLGKPKYAVIQAFTNIIETLSGLEAKKL